MEHDPYQIIADSPWFEGLPKHALEQLAAEAEIREFPVNSFIYELGKPTTEIYCIVSGRARISISSPNGHEFALVDREAGTWLGEPGLVNDEERILDARMIEPSEVLVIPRQAVLDVGEEHPLLYRNLFRYHQVILRDLHDLMGRILFYPLHARVAVRLLLLARDHGDRVEDGILINIKISQSDFARLTLGSRQRVNKVLRDWTTRGIVSTRDDLLLIHDLEALQQETEPFD